MPHCKCRMIQKHPRSGKPHNLPDLLPHLRLVAMHLTVRTECFLFHKGTFLASESGIIRKFLTGRTHLSCRFVIYFMILPAVQPDHFFHNAVPSAASFRLNPFILQPPVPVPQTLSFEFSGRNITNGIPTLL